MGYECDEQARKLADPMTGLKLEAAPQEDFDRAMEDTKQTVFDSNTWKFWSDNYSVNDWPEVMRTYQRIYANYDYPKLFLAGRTIGLLEDLIKTKRFKVMEEEPEPPAPEPSKDARGVLLSEIPAEVQADIDSRTTTTVEIKRKRQLSREYDAAFVESTKMQLPSSKPSVSISHELAEFARDWNSMAGTPRLVNGFYTVGSKQFRPEQFDLMLAKASEAQLIR
ncbi:MAG: hypothetical protein ACYDCM_07255 [Candidatus Acidiferrales bacterium]